MKKALLITLGVVAIGGGYLALTGFAGHCGGHGHGPARMERMVTHHVEDVLDDIQATPEQRTQILAIKDRLVARAKALHEGHGSLRQQLVAQWDAASPDVAKVDAIIDERAEAMKGFAHDVAGALAEVHGVLTPEQREKLSKRIHRRVDE